MRGDAEYAEKLDPRGAPTDALQGFLYILQGRYAEAEQKLTVANSKREKAYWHAAKALAQLGWSDQPTDLDNTMNAVGGLSAREKAFLLEITDKIISRSPEHDQDLQRMVAALQVQ